MNNHEQTKTVSRIAVQIFLHCGTTLIWQLHKHHNPPVSSETIVFFTKVIKIILLKCSCVNIKKAYIVAKVRVVNIQLHTSFWAPPSSTTLGLHYDNIQSSKQYSIIKTSPN